MKEAEETERRKIVARKIVAKIKESPQPCGSNRVGWQSWGSC